MTLCQNLNERDLLNEVLESLSSEAEIAWEIIKDVITICVVDKLIDGCAEGVSISMFIIKDIPKDMIREENELLFCKRALSL